MNSIKEIQEEIIDEFALFDEWMDKYEHLIELGKDLPIIKEQYKTDDNLITGCQSRVWLQADLVDGNIIFTADSDAIIDQIGLREHLSPTRSNGLVSMVKKIKIYSIAFQAKA